MAVLGDTVAGLVGRARLGLGERANGRLLTETPAFGANPGDLRMLSYAPDDLAAGGALVVVLHGCGQTAQGYAANAGWLDLAERYGFAVLCPEQTRANNANLCFTWFSPQDVSRGCGEAASIADMTAHAVAAYGVDPDRVFVTGLSAGGAMTAAMLAAYPEVFCAGAVIAGLPCGAATSLQGALSAMRGVPPLSAAEWGDKVRSAAPRSARWPRISVWHGDADTTVAPAAGDALVRQWTDVHGLSAPDEMETISPRHRRTFWRDAQGEILVEAHRIAGMGHGTPLAAGTEDGCGSPAPWILEAGVSSTFEIARSWGLTARLRHARTDASPVRIRPPAAAPRMADVAGAISSALKNAGLLR